jgi:2-deoxy-D-gluconate 3-dehydrogenase
MRYIQKNAVLIMKTDMTLFSLRGKTALVTGVSRGLGQAMTLALAQAGADIVGAGLQGMGQTREQIEALGRRCREIRADLAVRDQALALAREAIDAFGRVDILVNNAGIIRLSAAEDFSSQDFDDVMEVNLRSLFLLCREIGGQMLRLGGGKIINNCSVQSMKGGFQDSAYVASKHAVAGLTRALANEWGRHNIQVNGIAPGYDYRQHRETPYTDGHGKRN